jgi:hypothetical protein
MACGPVFGVPAGDPGLVNPESAVHETQVGDVAVILAGRGLFESFAALGAIQRKRFTRDDFPQCSQLPQVIVIAFSCRMMEVGKASTAELRHFGQRVVQGDESMMALRKAPIINLSTTDCRN